MGVGVTPAYQIRGFCLSWKSGLTDPGIGWCLEHINCLFGVVRAGLWVQMQTRQPSPSKRGWGEAAAGEGSLGQDGLVTNPLVRAAQPDGTAVVARLQTSLRRLLQTGRELQTEILRCADSYIYLWQFSREKYKLTPSVPLSLDLLIGITSNSQLYFKVWT